MDFIELINYADFPVFDVGGAAFGNGNSQAN